MPENDLKFKYRMLLLDAVIGFDLESVKRIKQTLAPVRLKELMIMKFDGKTPLLIAAQNNSCELVEYLLRECDADPEQVGRVMIDHESIDDASALWCSAAIGCLRCVKVLLEHGANVNTTTSTNSTPLRAACFDGHYEIVKYLIAHKANIELANQHGHTCLMIACYKKHYNIARFLIENGAQVNRQSLKGHSALHDCVDSEDSREIIELLLDNGAKFFKDFSGLSPLNAAALGGNSSVVEHFCSTPKTENLLSADDKEDAYRLLGATAVDKHSDLQLALRYWEEALRYRNPERTGFRQMKEIQFGDDDVQRNFYEVGFANCDEFETISDLDDLRYDPMKTHMQALLIRERIVGVAHPDTSFYVRSRGVNLVYMNNEQQCFALWMYMLKEQHDISKPLSVITQNSYISLIELISHMNRDDELKLRIKLCDIFRIWKLASHELLNSVATSPKRNSRALSDNFSHLFQFHPNKSDDVFDTFRDGVNFNGHTNPLDRQFLICIQLMGFMCQHRERMCPNLFWEFKKSVYRFLKRKPRSSCLTTFLQVMCFIRWSELWMPPNLRWFLDIFTLVVELAPDLDEIDPAGNTALHFLFRDRYFKHSWIIMLLERGAHLDVTNQAGRTPMELGETRIGTYGLSSLMCLCSQKVIKMLYRIEKHEEKEKILNSVPPEVRRFVEMHMPRSMPVYEDDGDESD